MKTSLQEIGKQLIAEGERIYLRDVQGALQEDDSNLAVRRSQEVVELALKGGSESAGCRLSQSTRCCPGVFRATPGRSGSPWILRN